MEGRYLVARTCFLKKNADKSKKNPAIINTLQDLWWLGTESNRRHADFQSAALPTELPSLL